LNIVSPDLCPDFRIIEYSVPRLSPDFRVQFGHELHDGFPTTAAFRRAVRAASKLLQTEYSIAVAAADRELAEALDTARPCFANN